MPRLDHRAHLETVLSPQEHLLLRLVLAEVNSLRQAVDLPPRSWGDLQQTLRAVLRPPETPPTQSGGA